MGKNITCLECKNDIKLEEREYLVGDIIECPYCGSELEVSKVSEGKISVDLIEEEK